ncbi:hypothetical protein JOD97_002847 [Duganella sp. 1411]|uniref:type III secretion system protein SctP n=1 Tax=Duganella sp. 1411 TaxID=2806572 RepID=UPI001AE6D9DA|nr:type III secretion system protein SctP [Duganella sp. 1411]MBP1204805.1 hypothetical protein [Duganella sp. 1411]
MPIKSTPPQPVRLLPRNEPAPTSANRQRALRQQFKNSYTEPEPLPPAEAEAPEFHVGRIRRHAVIRQEPPAAEDNAHHPDPAEPYLPPATPTATLSTRIARACARDEQANLRNARLAAIIAQFCNGPGILYSGGWQLQIAIDPALLPATRLHLTLSSCRLSLRFETAEPDSRRVILDNSKELQQRLSTLLPAQIEVDIVCW